MSITVPQARELQQIARTDPSRASAIIRDLIIDVNRLSQTKFDGFVAPYSTPLCAPKQVTPETTEQCEQRLLDELDDVRKAKEAAAAAANAEEAKNARLDAIDRATALSQATTEVLQAIRGSVSYNSGDVVSRDTWWKFRKDLAPVVAAHGFKLVNVGTKSKPKAALAEV